MHTSSATLEAVKIINKVLTRPHSLSAELEHIKSPHHKLITELCQGTLRWYEQLNFILNKLIQKPISKKNNDLYCLLLIGLYQLHKMETISPANSVNITVDASKALNKPWATNFTNAVLRTYLRKKLEIIELIKQNKIITHSFPKWLYSQIQADWPNDYSKILDNSNTRPSLCLRINPLKTDISSYTNLLNKKNISYTTTPDSAYAIIINSTVSIKALPHYDDGWFSIQNISAQYIAPLMNIQKNHSILDACAAPGGKTSHILELDIANIQVTAIDNKADKILRLKQNLNRLQHKATIITNDASSPNTWWNGSQFDRILIDAPCSGSGIISKYPEIKLRLSQQQINELNKTQLSLLTNLWPLLKPEGKLFYVTCSILKQENDEIIKKLSTSIKNYSIIHCQMPKSIQTQYGNQVLPQHNNHGFYLSCLQKTHK